MLCSNSRRYVLVSTRGSAEPNSSRILVPSISIMSIMVSPNGKPCKPAMRPVIMNIRIAVLAPAPPKYRKAECCRYCQNMKMTDFLPRINSALFHLAYSNWVVSIAWRDILVAASTLWPCLRARL